MKEASRYLKNARKISRAVPLEDDTYVDVKPVQEACGTAYLTVLKALDEYLMKKGVDERDLPQSVEGYRERMREYLSIHNGRLLREFEKLYKLLPVARYYRW